jgi:hypothetical protein
MKKKFLPINFTHSSNALCILLMYHVTLTPPPPPICLVVEESGVPVTMFYCV